MKALRLAAFIVAIIATCILMSVYTFETAVHIDVPKLLTKALMLLTQTAWEGTVATHCCVILQRGTATTEAAILAAIDKAVEEAGDRRATQAHLDALERLTRQPVIHRGPTLVPADRS